MNSVKTWLAMACAACLSASAWADDPPPPQVDAAPAILIAVEPPPPAKVEPPAGPGDFGGRGGGPRAPGYQATWYPAASVA
ncbi:MAG: hypothetical protein K1X57_22140, partial [Gemmataceae bacterium]|nr:hypothetical protein [Gemmataceae bacterium]